MTTKIKYLILVSVLCCTSVQAKDLYVSATGDDSTSYASNDISHPWLTPKYAWNNAQEGDTVYFRAGTYTTNNANQIFTMSSGNNGTSGSPITFKAYPGESVIITQSGMTITEETYGMIVIGKNYNVIENITFDMNNWQRGIICGYDSSVTGLTIRNCTFENFPIGDNRCGLYLGSTGLSYATIENCTFIGPTGGGGFGANILIFGGVNNLSIKNNDIGPGVTGISYKHGNAEQDDNIEIAYNYVHDCSYIGISLVCNYADIHDNITNYTCGTGLAMTYCAGLCGGDHNQIYHNTFDASSKSVAVYNYTQGTGDITGSAYNNYVNNIFTHPFYMNEEVGSTNLYGNTWDYNLYPSGTAVYHNNRASSYTLAQWQSYSSEDDNSIAGTPNFVGGSTPDSISEYGIASGTGNNAASDGKDMGADVTLVGPNASGSGTPSPPTLSNVTISNGRVQ